MTWDITRWDNAAYIVAVVLGCGFSAVITLLLGGYVHSHRAWKDGYDEGYLEGCKDIENLWESEARAGRDIPWWDPSPIDVEERIAPYVSPVDPPTASYLSY